MATDSRKAFEEALAKLEEDYREALLAIISQIVSQALRDAVEEAVVIGDHEAVVQLLHMDARIWGRLDARTAATFIAGGLYQVDVLPKTKRNGGRFLLGFTGRHERAERWVREQSSRLIQEITSDVREVVRDTLRSGIEEGAGARVIARRIIGTTVKGERQGGVVGLHSQQAKWVANARRELAEGDYSAYLTRTARDRRFDRTVAKAAREGRALTAKEIETMAGRYADRLLQNRGRTIAATEAHSAFNAGRFEALQQNVEAGEFPASAVKLVWQATPGSRRTRDSHAAMNGQEVRMGEPFRSPNGALLRHPMDRSLGAPASETINCRCTARTVIDYAAMAI